MGFPSFGPADVLGPTIVGGVCEGVLQGLLLSQLIFFIENPTKKRIWRFAVYWVNAVAL